MALNPPAPFKNPPTPFKNPQPFSSNMIGVRM